MACVRHMTTIEWQMHKRASASVSSPDAPWANWQVALSRSGQDAGVCPFCNKANYSVIYRAKTTAQRAAERREREHVEQAVLHARQVGLVGRITRSCSTQPWPCAIECQPGCTTDLLHISQEEERRSEHRRRKHAASESTPMSPEQV